MPCDSDAWHLTFLVLAKVLVGPSFLACVSAKVLVGLGFIACVSAKVLVIGGKHPVALWACTLRLPGGLLTRLPWKDAAVNSNASGTCLQLHTADRNIHHEHTQARYSRLS